MYKNKLLFSILILVCIVSGCHNGQINKALIKQASQSNSTPINVDEEDSLRYYLVIYNGFLLGGHNDGIWYGSSEIYSKINGEEKYKIYTFDRHIGEGVGSKPVFQELGHSDLINIDIKYKDEYIDNDYTALNCNWNAMPRTPIIQSNESKTYKEIVKEMLKNNGVEDDTPINIKQNIKVDLEGDGIDEVIIMAENVSPLAGYLQNNSYSILFVRKIVNNEVINIFIEKDIVVTSKDYVESVAITYNIKSIIDTDGDGILELLVESVYHEGIGYNLYKIEDDGIRTLLSKENGA